jgi:hypothetical protein
LKKVFLYDNENGFAQVAEYKNGELISKGDYCSKWLYILKDALEE